MLTQEEQSLVIDTDSPEIRILRTANHSLAEGNLEQLKGLNIQERLDSITDWVTKGIHNVKGDEPKAIRANGVRTDSYKYPDEISLRDTLYPAYTSLINSLYEITAKINPALREESLIKLAAVVYSFGILVHPFRDINGQRLLLAASSYIREARFKRGALPYKPSKGEYARTGQGVTSIITESIHMTKDDIDTADEITVDEETNIGTRPNRRNYFDTSDYQQQSLTTLLKIYMTKPQNQLLARYVTGEELGQLNTTDSFLIAALNQVEQNFRELTENNKRFPKIPSKLKDIILKLSNPRISSITDHSKIRNLN